MTKDFFNPSLYYVVTVVYRTDNNYSIKGVTKHYAVVNPFRIDKVIGKQRISYYYFQDINKAYAFIDAISQ